jgi:2-keto-4-pentenoate hydratase/2-oxohepta-3-ene-1,7-dioic acid hydratase in catechol pathway
VSVDSFPDPDDIGLGCSVAGEVMQDARSNDLIFGVPELVAYLSSICTLVPGDLIFTGTPAGVGAVVAGDVMQGEISGLSGIRVDVVPA